MSEFNNFLPLLGEAPTLALLLVLWFQIRDIGKKVDSFKERIGERMGKVELAVAALREVVLQRQTGD